MMSMLLYSLGQNRSVGGDKHNIELHNISTHVDTIIIIYTHSRAMTD